MQGVALRGLLSASLLASLLVMPATRQFASPRTAVDRDVLASRENPWLKKFRRALRPSAAPSEGYVGVEGMRLVTDALRSRSPIEALLVSTSGEKHLERLRPDLETHSTQPIRILKTSDRLFAGVAGTESPQGIAALVQPRPVSFEDLLRSSKPHAPLIATLVSVQDPGNVGTILRAAEAFGATGAATCSFGSLGTAHPHSPKALRASAGSSLRLPILHGVGVAIFLTQLRLANVKIYAATADNMGSNLPAGALPILSPWELNWKDAVALLIGNEGVGLPEGIARSADALVRIPLSNSVESLNAAIAAAVLLYEAARQRRRP